MSNPTIRTGTLGNPRPTSSALVPHVICYCVHDRCWLIFFRGHPPTPTLKAQFLFFVSILFLWRAFFASVLALANLHFIRLALLCLAFRFAVLRACLFSSVSSSPSPVFCFFHPREIFRATTTLTAVQPKHTHTRTHILLLDGLRRLYLVQVT